MYLSNRDIKWAIECGKLVVTPRPEEFGAGYDETSIDLHLDAADQAKIWNADALAEAESDRGAGVPELLLGTFNWARFSERYLIEPPPDDGTRGQRVSVRGREVIVRTGGFLLWTTKEKVGTPKSNPELICFVNAKSTRARTGLLVHFTAPTIHAGWEGKIYLEIANLGPFDFVLRENDAIAQLTVATISSATDLTLKVGESVTMGQDSTAGGRTGRRQQGRQRGRRQSG